MDTEVELEPALESSLEPKLTLYPVPGDALPVAKAVELETVWLKLAPAPLPVSSLEKDSEPPPVPVDVDISVENPVDALWTPFPPAPTEYELPLTEPCCDCDPEPKVRPDKAEPLDEDRPLPPPIALEI